MNIGVNARHLIKNQLEGIGWYSFEILRRITTSHPEHNFYFFFDRKYSDEFIFSSNVHPVVVLPQARHPVLFKWWFDYALPKKFKEYKIDLFFSPDGFMSLRTNVHQIGVIHDLNFEHYPNDLPKSVLKFYKNQMPKFAAKANHILTVSNFSKQDIIKCYGISDDKISVVHNGHGEGFLPLNMKEREGFCKNNNNNRPYFIYVGSLHKRKNITRMLTAFKKFNKGQNNSYDFIIIGEPMWKGQLNLDGLTQNVKFLGRKSGEELGVWVSSSIAMVYVSYFEGFGLPVLEGMCSGVPVITSNVTSMPEVGGKAVIYTEPFSVDSIKEGLEKAVEEGSFENYRELGLKQAGLFSWDKSAQKIVNLLFK
ncbi:MAG: glycosyltransferase [Crocinitomicaceae bacterium]|nr:glycosyltransferase [Crocinitomicaceae bacterium]|tara:strand:- start:3617 stop:4714 length:1098 start_codon:yes stop_codon:yes gene_type:complete